MVRAGFRTQLPASSCTASSWPRKIHCHKSERNCKAEGRGDNYQWSDSLHFARLPIVRQGCGTMNGLHYGY
jgi:hypothetical protein